MQAIVGKRDLHSGSAAAAVAEQDIVEVFEVGHMAVRQVEPAVHIAEAERSRFDITAEYTELVAVAVAEFAAEYKAGFAAAEHS